jgi:hypothetical protein
MTQKQTQFKGKSKKKTVPPNRHGKAPHVRKGTRARTDRGVPHVLDCIFLCVLLLGADFVDCSLGWCCREESCQADQVHQ